MKILILLLLFIGLFFGLHFLIHFQESITSFWGSDWWLTTEIFILFFILWIFFNLIAYFKTIKQIHISRKQNKMLGKTLKSNNELINNRKV